MEQDPAHEDEERHRDEGEAGGVRPRDRAHHAEPDAPALEIEQPRDAHDAERERDLHAHREQHEHRRDEEGAEERLAHSALSGGGSSSACGPPSARSWATSATSMTSRSNASPSGMSSIVGHSGYSMTAETRP